MGYLLNIPTIQALGAALLLIMAIMLVCCKYKLQAVRKETAKKKLLDHGIEAEAIILDITPTGLFVNNSPQSKVQIQVQPNKGRNFVTEVQQVLPDIYFGNLHSGSKIIVKYNPDNHKEIVLVRAA